MTAERSNMNKNWHWKQRECGPWAKTWFESELPKLSTSKTRIASVKDVEEDCCTVGMRKMKLITVYDFKITCVWEGKTEGDAKVTGLIVAQEVQHDMDLDDYVYEIFFEDPAGFSSDKNAQALLEDVKKNLKGQLSEVFQRFPKAMIETHGKDLLAALEADGASPEGSGTSTPVSSNAPSVPATAQPAKAASAAAPSQTRTSTVRTEGEFMISASDLFELLTDAKKVPTWSRNAATISPIEGSQVSLFGGNITGQILSVNKPSAFVQTFRAPTWPEGHHGKLSFSLQQGTGSTKLVLQLEGVPAGKEDETEKGIEIYYIRSLKQIGSVLSSRSSIPKSAPVSPHPWALPNFPKQRKGALVLLASSISIMASVLIPIGMIGLFGWLLYRGPTFQSDT